MIETQRPARSSAPETCLVGNIPLRAASRRHFSQLLSTDAPEERRFTSEVCCPAGVAVATAGETFPWRLLQRRRRTPRPPRCRHVSSAVFAHTGGRQFLRDAADVCFLLRATELHSEGSPLRHEEPGDGSDGSGDERRGRSEQNRDAGVSGWRTLNRHQKHLRSSPEVVA